MMIGPKQFFKKSLVLNHDKIVLPCERSEWSYRANGHARKNRPPVAFRSQWTMVFYEIDHAAMKSEAMVGWKEGRTTTSDRRWWGRRRSQPSMQNNAARRAFLRSVKQARYGHAIWWMVPLGMTWTGALVVSAGKPAHHDHWSTSRHMAGSVSVILLLPWRPIILKVVLRMHRWFRPRVLGTDCEQARWDGERWRQKRIEKGDMLHDDCFSKVW